MKKLTNKNAYLAEVLMMLDGEKLGNVMAHAYTAEHHQRESHSAIDELATIQDAIFV